MHDAIPGFASALPPPPAARRTAPTRRGPLRAVALASLLLAACGGPARLEVADGTGPSPALPEPEHALIPTIKVARATGWSGGAKPTVAPGLAIDALATGLAHPRWLFVLPNGDVLVAETNAPPKPDDTGGVRGYFMRLFFKRAGAATPSADRITLLRGPGPDGRATLHTVFVDGLHSPFGMALAGGYLYIADTDAVVRIPYRDGDTRAGAAPERVTDLPAGTINHHWTKSLIASPDGRTLYATVGSNSNVGERGVEAEEGRAAIWAIDVATGQKRLFAAGLRNPNGMAFEPRTGALWTAVNERDELGSDLVPDYMTRVRDGGFYGWPYSYFGNHLDTRPAGSGWPSRPELVAGAIVPDYALGPHTASLGLAWSGGTSLPPRFTGGMFVGQHGSWNRDPPSGYRVIFVPFADGMPSGMPVDVVTGFLDAEGQARGRPVGVAIDRSGALLVADDVGNAVWRVSAAR